MRGYKALNEDMSSKYGDMTYELNKEYEIEGKLIMCENGYHFCNELFNVYYYYPSDSRVFEIDTLDGEIIEKGDKYCTNKIKIIKEISEDEINKYIEDNLDILINDPNPNVREEKEKKGYGLDILISDEDSEVKEAVANQGYGLDKLINDEDLYIRLEVVKQGYGLDKLINDEDPFVRVAVARQGYGLDILINDKNPYVRAAVANQGYGLDKLINDEDLYIRAEVARQGYGLDKLINDEDPYVRERARTAKQLYENKE